MGGKGGRKSGLPGSTPKDSDLIALGCALGMGIFKRSPKVSCEQNLRTAGLNDD